MNLLPLLAWNKKRLIILLSAVALLICAGLLSAARPTAQNSAVGETCIRCHVGEFNQASRQAVKHPPFWDRQCTVCHLQPGSSLPATSVTAASRQITGVRVSQEPLWRKQRIFGSELRARSHQVSINGLQPEAAYRFRLQVAEEQSAPFAAGLWRGLRAAELLPTESREILLEERAAGRALPVSKLSITSVAADTLIVSWATAQPLFSWLELQELDGVEFVEANSSAEVQSGHPTLRDPVEVAINACYQCHPESSLGASHPVRLYGGRDVRIPAELPTVDGMLTCVTCHDPHGAPGKMLVREIIKTKLCVTCHYKYKNSSPSTMFRD